MFSSFCYLDYIVRLLCVQVNRAEYTKVKLNICTKWQGGR
nr:MAG TPA: hypothetical protein [Caudoviricetes sp.]